MSLADLLYARVARRRRAWFAAHPEARRRLHRPVVSVGNLAVGGSGKTPLVAAIARLLLDAGERPAILSRGYARREPADGVVVVRDASRVRADLARAGDEPLMLARALPGAAVLVSPDRHLAGVLAESRLGCTVHLLDDGFQHLALDRDVNLLLADERDLVAPRVLPGGRLREPPDAASAADALLVGEGDLDPRELAARWNIGAAFRLHRRAGPPVDEPAAGLPPLAPPARVVAVAGIARPERVAAALVAQGFEVASAMAFRDHHPYRARDLAAIDARRRETDAAAVVTTAKDLVRLLPLRPWPFRLAWLPVEVEVEPAGGFRAWLLERVRAAAGRRAA